MNKIKNWLAAWLLILAVDPVAAQLTAIRAVKLGDAVPDMTFAVSDFKGRQPRPTRLSDYRSKLLILDFWGSGCGSCIAGMPEMVALQDEFKAELQVLVVTEDTSVTSMLPLWDRLEKGSSKARSYYDAGKRLPFVIGDAAFGALFPHAGNPTHVWITPEGIFHAIAHATTTNAETIRAVLNGEAPWLADKPYPKFRDGHRPMEWIEGNFDNVAAYSMLVKGDLFEYPTNLPNKIIDSVTNSVIGLNFYNTTVFDLYELAYWESGGRARDKIVLEMGDKERYQRPPYDEAKQFEAWKQRTWYSYSIKVPMEQSDRLFETMKLDLQRHFGWSGSLESRMGKHLVLRRTSGRDRIGTRGATPSATFEGIKDEYSGKYEAKLVNRPFGELLRAIPYNWLTTNLLINETGFDLKMPIDMVLRFDKPRSELTLAEINQQLRKYDLTLVEEMRPVEVLVIRDVTDQPVASK